MRRIYRSESFPYSESAVCGAMWASPLRQIQDSAGDPSCRLLQKNHPCVYCRALRRGFFRFGRLPIRTSIHPVVQIAPEFFRLLEDVGVFGLLVDADELAILHEELAGGDGRLALAARHAEDHVPVDVLVGERGEGLIVHDDDVRRRAPGLSTPSWSGEVLRADLGVVPEEHVRDLAPADVRQAVLAALGAEGDLERLEHIVGVGVGAHAKQDPVLVQLDDRTDADGVAHVALGVVDDHRARLGDQFHLGSVDVDAVSEDRLFAEDAVILQALDGAAAVVLEGVIDVVHALGDVDVEARAAVVGPRPSARRVPVADGEERVPAEHRREHRVVVRLTVGDEVGIFLDGLQALLLAVAVGDLVARAAADAELLALSLMVNRLPGISA